MRKIKTLTTSANRHRCHCVLTIILLLAAASASRAQTSHFASAYYNRGNERYKKGDLDGAISDFDAALTFDPRLAVAYNMRGCARYHKQDLTAASRTIQEPSSSILIWPWPTTIAAGRGTPKET